MCFHSRMLVIEGGSCKPSKVVDSSSPLSYSFSYFSKKLTSYPRRDKNEGVSLSARKVSYAQGLIYCWKETASYCVGYSIVMKLFLLCSVLRFTFFYFPWEITRHKLFYRHHQHGWPECRTWLVLAWTEPNWMTRRDELYFYVNVEFNVVSRFWIHTMHFAGLLLF